MASVVLPVRPPSMHARTFPPLVEAFLILEQPRQRLSHWTEALTPLDDGRAPPLATVSAYYDPTTDQALLGLRYDELALGPARLGYIIEIALLAEIGMIQASELSEGDRRRFLGERLARCSVIVTDQRNVVSALTELVRRVREQRGQQTRSDGPRAPRPPLAPAIPLLASSARARGTPDDPVLLVQPKSTRNRLEPLPHDPEEVTAGAREGAAALRPPRVESSAGLPAEAVAAPAEAPGAAQEPGPAAARAHVPGAARGQEAGQGAGAEAAPRRAASEGDPAVRGEPAEPVLLVPKPRRAGPPPIPAAKPARTPSPHVIARTVTVSRLRAQSPAEAAGGRPHRAATVQMDPLEAQKLAVSDLPAATPLVASTAHMAPLEPPPPPPPRLERAGSSLGARRPIEPPPLPRVIATSSQSLEPLDARDEQAPASPESSAALAPVSAAASTGLPSPASSAGFPPPAAAPPPAASAADPSGPLTATLDPFPPESHASRKAMIYARYLRSGRWAPLRIGALSLRGAALTSAVLPRLHDRVDVALAFGELRALVRGPVSKVSTQEETAQSGAASFSVTFELDEVSRRQLTALLKAARAAGVTIKPPPPRGSRRFPVEWPVCLGTTRGAIRAEALDVSRGGMFVRPANALTLAGGVTFSAALDDGDGPVSGRCRVVRFIDDAEARNCGLAPGYGLQILEMPPPDRARWGRFLERIERRAEKRVLIGAVAGRLVELQGALVSAGYNVVGATDPEALALIASHDRSRSIDACLIDAGWLPPGPSGTWAESLFPTRVVPCVTLRDELRADPRRARAAIDQVLSIG